MQHLIHTVRLIVAIPAGIFSIYLILFFAGDHFANLGAAFWPILTICIIVLMIFGGAAAGMIAGLRPMIFGAAVGLFFIYVQVQLLGSIQPTNPRWFDLTLLVLTLPATMAGGYFSSVLLRRLAATRTNAT